MSDVSLSGELSRCCEAFGWTWGDLRRLAIDALSSAFIPVDQQQEIMTGVIDPWYASRGGF